MKKWIIALSILLALITINLCVLTRNYMPIRDIEPIEYQATVVRNFTKEDVIKRVSKHFNIQFKLHWKSNVNYAGKAFIYSHNIILNTCLNEYAVGETLAHELCHIKYYSANETYVEFMAFKELYESGDEILVDCAKYMIIMHCENRVNKGTRYDVGYYILKYLEETK